MTSNVDGTTINPLRWSEVDFFLWIALLLLLAAIVSYAITRRLHLSAKAGAPLSAMEMAALIDEQTLLNAIELDLILQGHLEVVETQMLPFRIGAMLQTRFTPAGLEFPLDGMQRWAVARLVSIGAMDWAGTPKLSPVEDGVYRNYRKALQQQGFLLAEDVLLRQTIQAMLPFLVPLLLLVLWLAQSRAAVPSALVLGALVAALAAMIFAGGLQIQMTPAACARFKQTRDALRGKSGAGLPREALLTAFACFGYSVLRETPLQQFGNERHRRQNGD